MRLPRYRPWIGITMVLLGSALAIAMRIHDHQEEPAMAIEALAWLIPLGWAAHAPETR